MRQIYCLKGKELCWWTVRPTPREAWEAGYPKSPAESESDYVDRIARIQNSELIECVSVELNEATR